MGGSRVPQEDGQPIAQTPVILGKGGPSEAGWHGIADFLRCAKEYQYRQVRGLRHPQAQVPDHFAKGILHHAMRARWFSLRFATDEKAWESLRDAAREAAEEQALPTSAEAMRQALIYMAEYVDYWKRRPQPDPVAAEYKIGPAPLAPEDPFFLFRTARLDDVSRYPEAGGKLCIGESKTTSTSIHDCVNEYTLHGQPMLQAILWKMCPNGEKTHGPVAGIMLDVLVKGYGGKRSQFGRTFIPITQRSMDWYVANLRQYLRAAAMVDWNADAPRNIASCTRMAGRARIACEFRDLCTHGRSVSIKYVLKDGSSLLTWKPTADRKVAPWE